MATDYRAMARQAARRYGLDANIFVRQMAHESINFDPDVVSGRRNSPAGAQGIAQIMPDTAKAWGVDPLNPKAALNAAAKNMASYVRKYGSYEKALRAYNAGPGAIERSKGYRETNNYVNLILRGRDPKRLSKPSKGGARASTTTTTPGQTISSAITTGGDVTVPELPQRQRPPITGPALPDYVRNPPPTIAMPDRTDQQAGLSAAIAALGKVPQTTTESTTVLPGSSETTTTRAAPKGGKGGSKVLELIFNDGGKGYGIKDGKQVDGPSFYSGTWGGHADHVHVAAGPKTVVALGKVAQKMGLHVGENPAFDRVDPVHTTNSYHYRKRAIDVSGNKSKMKKFARFVADYNKTRRL